MCPATATPTSFFEEEFSFRGLTFESVKAKMKLFKFCKSIFGVHVSDVKIRIKIVQPGNRRRRRHLQTSGSQIVVVYTIKANSDTQKSAIKSKFSNAEVFAAKAVKPLSAALGVSSNAFTIAVPASTGKVQEYGSLIENEVQDGLVKFKVTSDFLNYILADRSSSIMPSCPPGTIVDRSSRNNEFERLSQMW